MNNIALKTELENFSDTSVFEELAFFVMKENYPMIEKIGGVQDNGKDAQEEIHYPDGTIFHRRFQFSIEKDARTKIQKTITRYQEKGVEWDELVYVTNHCVNTIEALKTWFTNTYNKPLVIQDQSAIEYVLITNPRLWKMFFPDVPLILDIEDNRFANELLRKNMLKCALLYAKNDNDFVKGQRYSLFEQAILSIGMSQNEFSAHTIISTYRDAFHKDIDVADVEKAIKALYDKKLIDVAHTENNTWIVKQHVIDRYNQNQHIEDDCFSVIIEDVLTNVTSLLKGRIKLSMEQQSQIRKNTKDALNKFFQLFGADFVIDQRLMTDVGKQDLLKQIAATNLENPIADTILYSIGQILASPSAQQAHTLSLLSKTFICAQMMQIDPLMNACQKEVLKGKIFILDTDVVLHCIVEESNLFNAYQKLIIQLLELGCIVCVPSAVIEEVRTHAESARGNYKRFRASYETNDASTLKEDFRNVFVDGFINYLAKNSNADFDKYIANYYNKDNPDELIRLVLDEFLPKGVIIGDDLQWNQNIVIPEEDLSKLTNSIYQKTSDTIKGGHRGVDGNFRIAYNDAYIYLTAYHIANSDTDSSDLLAKKIYVVTMSTRTIRVAKQLDLYRSVVTKPHILISVLGEVYLSATNEEFVDLLGNPFLSKIAAENWDNLEILAQMGVDMRDKKTPLLIMDLKKCIHKQLTDEVKKEIQLEDIEQPLLPGKDEMQEYIDMVNEVEQAGYKMMPKANVIIKRFREVIDNDIKKDHKIKQLEDKNKKKISKADWHFSKEENIIGKPQSPIKFKRK